MVTRKPPVLALSAALLLARSTAPAAESEDDYYRLVPIPVPEGIVLEASGIDVLEGDTLLVCTRRGDVYAIEGAFADPPGSPRYTLFATGLHEPLGLAARDGAVYVTQRGEVTRLVDEDGDGRADLFETVADGWGLSGDYHEYAFGSQPDLNGDIWVVLCLTGSFTSEVLFRGWCLKVSLDGTITPIASGIRSPGGIGRNAAGDMFYTDNQGPWNGSCSLRQILPGAFLGHPDGNRWYDHAPALGPRPLNPRSGGRIATELERVPELMPPAVIFPYNKMGQSASGIACDVSGGKLGPFREQLFVGDQTHSTVMRVFLETVEGRYQGACFPFREGFGSGALGLRQAPDGSLLVGCTERGWGARGGKPFSLERVVWTGKTPFEVLAMRVVRGGFELELTEPADPATATALESYRLETYTYIYQSSYGSPEVDRTTPPLLCATLSDDHRRVLLGVEGLQRGHVHELHLPGLRSEDGRALLHPVAYYTLYYLP